MLWSLVGKVRRLQCFSRSFGRLSLFCNLQSQKKQLLTTGALTWPSWPAGCKNMKDIYENGKHAPQWLTHMTNSVRNQEYIGSRDECPKVRDSERLGCWWSPLSFCICIFAFFTFLYQRMGGGKEGCVFVWLCGEWERHIRVRFSLWCLFSDKSDNNLWGGFFLCFYVCVLAQLVLQDRFKSTYAHNSSCIRNLTRYTKH